MRTWLIVLALVEVLAIGAMVVDGQGPVSKEEVQESKPLQIVGVTTGVVVMDESNNRLTAFQMQNGQLRIISVCNIFYVPKPENKKMSSRRKGLNVFDKAVNPLLAPLTVSEKAERYFVAPGGHDDNPPTWNVEEQLPPSPAAPAGFEGSKVIAKFWDVYRANEYAAIKNQHAALGMGSVVIPRADVGRGCLGEYMSGSVDGTPRMTNPPPRRSKHPGGVSRPISVDGVPTADNVEDLFKEEQ